MFMNQISSLRELHFSYENVEWIPKVSFAFYPGAKDCLKNLSTLSCGSNIYPEFFSQLYQICHNIQSLRIEFRFFIPNELNQVFLSRCLVLLEGSDPLRLFLRLEVYPQPSNGNWMKNHMQWMMWGDRALTGQQPSNTKKETDHNSFSPLLLQWSSRIDFDIWFTLHTLTPSE